MSSQFELFHVQEAEENKPEFLTMRLRAIQRCRAVIGEWGWGSKSIVMTAQTSPSSGL